MDWARLVSIFAPKPARSGRNLSSSTYSVHALGPDKNLCLRWLCRSGSNDTGVTLTRTCAWSGCIGRSYRCSEDLRTTFSNDMSACALSPAFSEQDSWGKTEPQCCIPHSSRPGLPPSRPVSVPLEAVILNANRCGVTAGRLLREWLVMLSSKDKMN